MIKLAIRSLAMSAMFVASAAYSQVVTHAYDLGSSLNDVVGSIALGSDGGTISGGAYNFGANQGLTLSNVFTNNNATPYTIVFDAELSDVSGYKKLVDFDDKNLDAGFYDYDGETNLFNSGIYDPAYADNTYAFTVLTRSATGVFSVYVNGAFISSYNDQSTEYSLFTGPNGIARFFEDDNETGQREASGGSATYLAVYDGALSAEQAEALNTGNEVTGSNVNATPEPASFALFATGLVGVFGVARRRHNRRPSPGVTT